MFSGIWLRSSSLSVRKVCNIRLVLEAQDEVQERREIGKSDKKIASNSKPKVVGNEPPAEECSLGEKSFTFVSVFDSKLQIA